MDEQMKTQGEPLPETTHLVSSDETPSGAQSFASRTDAYSPGSTQNPPCSGVQGLSPSEVRERLVSNGWPVLPILAHDGGSKGSGKAPAVREWQQFASFEGPMPSRDDLANWTRMGHAPGTGIACGRTIAIDIDFAEDAETGMRIKDIAEEVFGPTPFVRQGREPKMMLIYRAAEPVPKKPLKRADKSGDGIDIQGVGSQIVAYGIHPTTNEPYRWIGEAEPLDTSLAVAPEITAQQVETFLERVGKLCEWTSSSSLGRGARHGESAAIVRDASGRVIDGREGHLTETVYRVACEMYAEDPDIAARKSELVERAWTRFDETASTADGRWTLREVEVKANALIAKVASGKIKLNDPPLAVASDRVVARMNEQYCVVREGGKTRVLSFEQDEGRMIPIYQSFEDFRNFTMHEKVLLGDRPQGVGQYWLNHPKRRQYSGVTFKPNGEPEINGRLNLWRGWGVVPRQGVWSLMRDHIINVLADGNEEHGRYIIKWAAWAVQHPDKVPEVALVFQGAEGTGKGFFGRAMMRIFGQHGLQISSVRHLAGNFNAHLRDTCLLFADEAFWAGDKTVEGTLKRVLTEDTLFIELKGIDGFKCPNFLHVIIASNEDWVVPTGPDARRFAVFRVSSERKQDETYFAALNHELQNGGLEAMLNDLQSMDLTGFHPRRAPKTEALREQQITSLKPEEAWLLSLLQAGRLPGASDEKPDIALARDLLDDLRESSPQAKYISAHRLGIFLREKGVVPGQRVENARCWRFPPLSEMRAAWEKRMPDFVWDHPQIKDWDTDWL